MLIINYRDLFVNYTNGFGLINVNEEESVTAVTSEFKARNIRLFLLRLKVVTAESRVGLFAVAVRVGSLKQKRFKIVGRKKFHEK